MTIAILFKLLGSLALLIYGMKMMSEALQKLAGPSLRHVLGAMTTNRFTGILTGIIVTAAVQSSTATTVMTVSFVNASLLTLSQAISVIMGANIGTTLTAWIMTLAMADGGGGVSFSVTDLVFPSFVVAMFLIYKKRHRIVGDFIFGIAFLFLGLGTLRQTGVDMHLGENPAVLDFFASFDPQSFTTTLIFLLLGGILTMCVQSSAAVMAITMILCSSGALPIYQGIALVMGENIGTTVTSNLAALSASTQARRAAFAHMFFNLFGVAWMLLVFHMFIDAVCGLVGYDVTMTKEIAGQEAFMANAAKLSVVLATFHTCFNVTNTFILVWFVPQIERIVCYVIPDKKRSSKGSSEGASHLQFIEGGLMATPEISVLQAQKEVTHFAERMQRMFGMVVSLVDETDKKEIQRLMEKVAQDEELSDNMELEIAAYLEQVSNDHLSDDTKGKIRSMLRQISELESIGDACYNVSRALNRKREGREEFTPEQTEHLHEMLRLVNEGMARMITIVAGRREDLSIDLSRDIERDINELRNTLKAKNIQDVNAHLYSYALGTLYVDIISSLEKMGDYIMNVVEARLNSSFT
ncbi:MAG: Na/Pi cotransporter family protein [Bacteroidaceae bacterium]|nr:Na/Pi cotransporter family protein [Bacteroidaceae bacterium]